MTHRNSSLLWYLLIALVVLALYGSLIHDWWYYDDPSIIVFIADNRISEFLFDPNIWQSFSPFNLVPWVLLSLKFDMLFSGFDPAGYYLHQIIALIIVSIALFSVLSLYLKKRLFSFLGVVIFLLHPATFAVVSWISTRHYLEGLGFALISLFFYVRALRDKKYQLLCISNIFYLLAIVAKEIYVPTPFLFILLQEKKIKERLQYAIPSFILAGFYVIYRTWMLGENSVGGYSSIWEWTIESAVLSTSKIFYSYGDSWWIFGLVSFVIVWSFRYIDELTNSLKILFRGILIFLLFYIPILPVSPLWGGFGSLRYFFLISLFITFCYMLAVNVLYERGRRIINICLISLLMIVIAGFSFTFYQQKAEWNTEKIHAYEEGHFFLANSENNNILFKISQPHWFFDGLEKLQTIKTQNKTDREIKLVVGDFYTIDDTETDFVLFSYDHAKQRVINVSQNAGNSHNAFLKTVKANPLTVDMIIKNGVLDLQLGPYEGQYIFLEASPSQPGFYYMAEPINRRFGIKLTHREKVRIFCFAYTSPEGWITFSPEFLVDWSKDQNINWKR